MTLQQVHLHDDASGATADVLCGFGFNCFSFRPVCGGQAHEVLWSSPQFANGTERPSHSGIPILFPFPGRLRGQTLNYNTRDYPLDGDDGRGNAIHGYVLNRPWTVIEQTPSSVTGQFRASQVDAQLSGKWPSDFELIARYELAGDTLRGRYVARNTGDGLLPCGLGLHPYFRVPLAAGADAAHRAAECIVTVPVTHYWELENMLPTGRRLPTDAPRQLASGMPFAETKLDDVLSGVEFKNGWATARIEEVQSGLRLSIGFDEPFRECVVYNPPHREAICIEPYTCVPDTYWLTDQGIDAGLRELKPGEEFACQMEIRLEQLK